MRSRMGTSWCNAPQPPSRPLGVRVGTLRWRARCTVRACDRSPQRRRYWLSRSSVLDPGNPVTIKRAQASYEQILAGEIETGPHATAEVERHSSRAFARGATSHRVGRQGNVAQCRSIDRRSIDRFHLPFSRQSRKIVLRVTALRQILPG